MKYEIRRDNEIHDGRRTKVSFTEPAWAIYFEGEKNVGPSLTHFGSVYSALKHFIDGIGMNEGLVRINIETLKQKSLRK